MPSKNLCYDKNFPSYEILYLNFITNAAVLGIEKTLFLRQFWKLIFQKLFKRYQNKILLGLYECNIEQIRM